MHVWRTLARRVLLERAPFVRVVEETVEVAPGRVIDDFYRIEMLSFAVVVPVLEDGRILMCRQYRHGAGRICLSFPGGHLDPGETGAQAAARELREEAGLAAAELRALGSFVDNGNQRCAEGHYFVGLACQQIVLPDPGGFEDIQLEHKTVAEVDAALAKGEIAVVHHAAAWAMARPYIIG